MIATARTPTIEASTRRSFRRSIDVLALAFVVLAGCTTSRPYGLEQSTSLPGERRQVWAVAPAVNLSGQREVDALLQSDLLFQQLQSVRGLTVIPVDRVAQIYSALRIEQVQSPEQAAIVCEALGADALIVATVTAYDPYDPPKFGGALQMFRSGGVGEGIERIDPREMARAATPDPAIPPPRDGRFVQAVGMFDAANGSTRHALWSYARGRYDPAGPIQEREYLLSMDRYVGFAYHALIADLLRAESRATVARSRSGNGKGSGA